jgi:8-oxo-dGTP pyrophosphatase MutT (NUDIX family)
VPKDSKNVSKVILFVNEKILVLVRSDNGKFDLPGGHCHVGESFLSGAAREVKEETNLTIGGVEELFSYGRKMIYLAKSYSGMIDLDLKENSEYHWMDKEQVMDLDPRNSTDALITAKVFFSRK